MNITHPDDYEAQEEQHLELRDLQSSHNTMIIDNTALNLTLARSSTNDFVVRARQASSKYTDSSDAPRNVSGPSAINHAFLVGYYESTIRRLAEIPEARAILNNI